MHRLGDDEMTNKIWMIKQLTEEIAKEISEDPEQWIQFLDTASRVYKYAFHEQLLIYAQRPEATACASMEIWNKRMYRWVKKGATGIALLDTESGSKTRLRYVFDVKDTFKIRELGKDPYLWEINEEHHGILVSHLAKVMGYDGFGGNLADILHEIAQEQVENCIDDAYQECCPIPL